MFAYSSWLADLGQSRGPEPVWIRDLVRQPGCGCARCEARSRSVRGDSPESIRLASRPRRGVARSSRDGRVDGGYAAEHHLGRLDLRSQQAACADRLNAQAVAEHRVVGDLVHFALTKVQPRRELDPRGSALTTILTPWRPTSTKF
jgi:hypothetical protein